MAKKRAATKEEKEHMSKVAELGCIICRRPAAIHHILRGAGMGRKASNFEVLPLCGDHHQHGGYGVAIHAGIDGFEKNFGTEKELLEQVKALL